MPAESCVSTEFIDVTPRYWILKDVAGSTRVSITRKFKAGSDGWQYQLYQPYGGPVFHEGWYPLRELQELKDHCRKEICLHDGAIVAMELPVPELEQDETDLNPIDEALSAYQANDYLTKPIEVPPSPLTKEQLHFHTTIPDNKGWESPFSSPRFHKHPDNCPHDDIQDNQCMRCGEGNSNASPELIVAPTGLPTKAAELLVLACTAALQEGNSQGAASIANVITWHFQPTNKD